MLTPPEVARLLRIKPAKVLGWISRGELPATNVADSLAMRPRWRIQEADIAAFLTRRAAKPMPKMDRRRAEKIPQYV